MAVSVSLSKKELDQRQYKIVCEQYEILRAISETTDTHEKEVYRAVIKQLDQEYQENDERIMCLAREAA